MTLLHHPARVFLCFSVYLFVLKARFCYPLIWVRNDADAYFCTVKSALILCLFDCLFAYCIRRLSNAHPKTIHLLLGFGI